MFASTRRVGAFSCGLALTLLAVSTHAAVRRSGAEFLVNTYTPGSQSGSSFLSLADNGGLALFGGPTSKFPTNVALHARRYDAVGKEVSPEYVLNPDYNGFNEVLPHAAGFGTAGKFVVTWTDVGNEDLGTIRAIILGSLGVSEGNAFNVSLDSEFTQQNSDVAGTAQGFLVVWVDLGDPDISASNVLGRIYDGNGKASDDVVAIPIDTKGWPTAPHVAALANGDFMVVWEELDTDGSADGIVARRVSSYGAPVGAPIVVNARIEGPQQDPDIATLSDGNLVVVWRGDDGDQGGIFGRLLDADGEPLGDEFAVSTYTTGAQRVPGVVADTSGGFLVTWTSDGEDGSGSGVFARHFFSRGAADGEPFRVNVNISGNQLASDNAGLFLSSTAFVAGWRDSSDQRDGSGSASVAALFSLVPGSAPLCGDAANRNLIVSASDALAALRAAVGISSCALCVCDMDVSGDVSASDALAILKLAVGLDIDVSCPSC